MDQDSEIQIDTQGLAALQPAGARTQVPTFDDLESQLQGLENRIRELKVNSPLPWPTTREKIFDAALDLRVKADAVRWMLRVSKHLGGPARERVISTIANSRAQLEQAIEPIIPAA
jgi:hypothetical protein